LGQPTIHSKQKEILLTAAHTFSSNNSQFVLLAIKQGSVVFTTRVDYVITDGDHHQFMAQANVQVRGNSRRVRSVSETDIPRELLAWHSFTLCG